MGANLEAAHGEAAIAHGGTERVRLVLVPPNERAPILQEYVGVGPTAEAVARAVERRKRVRAESRRVRLRVEASDRLAADALRLAVLLARSELLLAGLYRHHGGGPWRVRRAKRAVA